MHCPSLRRSLVILTVFCILGTLFTSVLVRKYEFIPTFNQNQTHSRQQFLERICKQPIIDPFKGHFYSKFFKDVNPIKCKGDTDWIETSNGSVYISDRFTKDERQHIQCYLQYVIRVNDRKIKYSDKTKIPNDSKLVLKHDFFKADCTNVKTKKTYINIHPAISYKPDVHARKSENDNSIGLGLSVIIIHFDSMSRMTYMRKLKKTYKFIKEELKGYVLNGFNAIGDGTGQNLTPLLTGKIEKELPITLLTHPRGQPVDTWPFIWNEFRKYGYVTGYFEDFSAVGTYQLRLRGFTKEPTDHYMRPFYLAAEPTYGKYTALCLGSRRRSQVMFDYVKQFHQMYKHKPKFLLNFHGEMSHGDLNIVQTADDDLVELLTFLKDNGHFNNTMLILGSDHGLRFGSSRAHPQGKFEQLLPFFSISFPAWFEAKYPKLIQNLKINTNTLTTGFDVHEMFEDMLHFGGGGIGNLSSRGISLFKKVPFSRTCKHANVSEELCACNRWKNINVTDIRIQQAANYSVVYMNNLTSEYRKFCQILRLRFVKSAAVKMPRTKDEVYQIQLVTSPSGGIFEVIVHKIYEKGVFSINGMINRINKYGKDSKCIYNKKIKLRKFCYCKSKMPL